MTAVATKPRPATCQDLFARYNAAWQALQAVCRDEPDSKAHQAVHDQWWDRLSAANDRCNRIAKQLLATPATSVSDSIGKFKVFLNLYEGADLVDDKPIHGQIGELVHELAGLKGEAS